MNMDKYAPYNFRTQQFESLRVEYGTTADRSEALFFFDKKEAETRALQLNDRGGKIDWVAMKLADKPRNSFKKLRGETA